MTDPKTMAIISIDHAPDCLALSFSTQVSAICSNSTRAMVVSCDECNAVDAALFDGRNDPVVVDPKHFTRGWRSRR